MSVKMETDVSRAPVSVLPAAEPLAGRRVEPERPRCSSTPCSPVRSGTAGYQILHMDCNYLVGFATGEELLKRAHKRPGAEKAAAAAVSTSTPEASSLSPPRPKPQEEEAAPALHRASRVYKTKSRHYQPYDIPAVSGHRRRRRSVTGTGDRQLRPPAPTPPAGGGEPSRAFHGPLPLCLLRGKRPHPKSLDYLNLDKMAALEPAADTEVLQYQLQHLTLRGDRMYARNKT